MDNEVAKSLGTLIEMFGFCVILVLIAVLVVGIIWFCDWNDRRDDGRKR